MEQVVGGAGAEGAPRELARTEFRFRGVSWGDGALALLRESEYKTRRARTWQLEPASGRRHPVPLLEYSIEDLYRHPGSPMTALAVPPRPRPPPLPARRRRCPDELRRGRAGEWGAAAETRPLGARAVLWDRWVRRWRPTLHRRPRHLFPARRPARPRRGLRRRDQRRRSARVALRRGRVRECGGARAAGRRDAGCFG